MAEFLIINLLAAIGIGVLLAYKYKKFLTNPVNVKLLFGAMILLAAFGTFFLMRGSFLGHILFFIAVLLGAYSALGLHLIEPEPEEEPEQPSTQSLDERIAELKRRNK